MDISNYIFFNTAFFCGKWFFFKWGDPHLYLIMSYIKTCQSSLDANIRKRSPFLVQFLLKSFVFLGLTTPFEWYRVVRWLPLQSTRKTDWLNSCFIALICIRWCLMKPFYVTLSDGACLSCDNFTLNLTLHTDWCKILTPVLCVSSGVLTGTDPKQLHSVALSLEVPVKCPLHALK